MDSEAQNHRDEITDRAAENLVDKTVGHFRITEVIGHGAMGVVYKAYDSRLDRIVAIKTIRPHLLEDLATQERFRREAKTLAALSHAHIGVIYDILDQADGYTCLILEYVPGQTLAERIRDGPLPVKESLSVGLQIAESLAAAYEKGIVHRDLKPGNIKITPDGNTKVLDFGIARTLALAPAAGAGLAEEDTIAETATHPGRLIGTPAYMSPEQARGKPTDHRTDIWSFGCVMYEMLTGKVAFEGKTIPGNIRVLLRRCFEKDAHNRLQHIGDAAVEIRETLNPPATAPPVTTPSISPSRHVTAKARSRRIAILTASAIIIALSAVAVWFVLEQQTGPASDEIRLVVVPFENLGSSEDEYFAAGITDAITARLASIHGLAVISRQSALQYKKQGKSAQQIANELRVDYILEGTVQRERPSDATSRVRIIPQLVNASNDTHVWAQAYDNDMNEVFQVQSDLAERVAEALNITLVEREQQALRSRPTENMKAYDYYLRGNEYYNRSYLESDLRIAIRMYEKAVELDPKFALAYAQLSRCHATMYWFYYDHTSERLEMAKKAVDRALQLDPDLPEAHLALGRYYYYGHMDYDRALEQSAIVRKSQPNNSDLLSFIGYVQRRQGRFEEALANIKKASELDPLSNNVIFELGQTFRWMRDYPQAMRCFDRAISLAPDVPGPYQGKAELYLLWEGNKEKTRMVIEQAAKNISSFADDIDIVLTYVWLDIFDGKYQEALAQIASSKLEAFSSQDVYFPKAELCAQIYGLMGNKELEQDQYESAVGVLETRIQQEPNDARFHSALGIAYAGLGRKQDAIRQGKLAVELLPVSKDAMRSFYRAKDLAQIYVMVGEFDLAIDQIELLLSLPGELSVPLLQLEPAWSPLRDHPRFRKLADSTE
jgi:TolB-like protein/Flp pilus assembly protein TadD/tRNA A-37 threonylcarbamoyl transferase component Bud32